MRGGGGAGVQSAVLHGCSTKQPGSLWFLGLRQARLGRGRCISSGRASEALGENWWETSIADAFPLPDMDMDEQVNVLQTHRTEA